ncbi:hypothetical protein M9H77_14307 [Catharanthus roseus]|uniref:Uncharacterized protein n=1 Tax=Catharanthus roseus TaxID=4058 RepID=A0ACC0BMU5_CATRO|nr:hypothetical protein M9H77_14307 [Catharanthus roseus]
MSRNAMNSPKLSDNPIWHIRLNTVKVCKHPMPCKNPNTSYLLWPVRSPPDLAGDYSDITSSSDPQPDNSFASTREACPKFRYKYANVVAPHANPPAKPISFTSDHSIPGTLLLFLSVKSGPKLRRKSTTRGFCNLCQVLTIYTNIGVGNTQVALNNCNQLLPRIMMIDNVDQIIRMSSDAGTCKTSNVIISSPKTTLQLQDH